MLPMADVLESIAGELPDASETEGSDILAKDVVSW